MFLGKDRRATKLLSLLGEGGEAEGVFGASLGAGDLAIKVFPASQTPDDLELVVRHARERLRSRSAGADVGGGYARIAYPFALAYNDASGLPVGTVQHRVPSRFVSLNDYIRSFHGSLTSRCRVATNLALLVDDIHSAGYVIGDVSTKNFLVDPSTETISAIDVESWGFVTSTGVFRPPTAVTVHFQSKSRLSDTAADVFSLGCIVLNIILQLHPFAGTPKDGTSTSIQGNIDAGQSWLTSPNTFNIPRPERGHPGLRALTPELTALAISLTQGASQTAPDWGGATLLAIRDVDECACGEERFVSGVCMGKAHRVADPKSLAEGSGRDFNAHLLRERRNRAPAPSAPTDQKRPSSTWAPEKVKKTPRVPPPSTPPAPVVISARADGSVPSKSEAPKNNGMAALVMGGLIVWVFVLLLGLGVGAIISAVSGWDAATLIATGIGALLGGLFFIALLLAADT